MQTPRLDNAEPSLIDDNIINNSLIEDGKTLPPLLIPPTHFILLRSSASNMFTKDEVNQDFATKQCLFDDYFGEENSTSRLTSDFESKKNEYRAMIHENNVKGTKSDDDIDWNGLNQNLQLSYTRSSTSNGREEINKDEVFSIIRNLRDPEYPDTTLEQLSVVSKEQITIDTSKRMLSIGIRFTPTVPHCSQATIIGLSIRKMMEASLGVVTHRLYIEVEPGTHHDDKLITKQINDKERIGAAMESPNVRRIVFKAMKGSFTTTNTNGQLWRRI